MAKVEFFNNAHRSFSNIELLPSINFHWLINSGKLMYVCVVFAWIVWSVEWTIRAWDR